MNSRFFDVKKNKQDAIINAALTVFSQKGYKDASTDVIVKSAGISKGLLFHYFTSKQGLYEFICDYSSKYMILELTRTVKKSEKDLFSLMSQISSATVRVMKNYPCMPKFLRTIRFEDDPEAVSAMGDCLQEMDRTYRNIYEKIDSSTLIDPSKLQNILNIVEWVKNGFLEERFAVSVPDTEGLYEEYEQYLTLLRDHFYASKYNEKVSVARDEFDERNETVMKEMKMDMTFEERLQAGRQPLVETDDEEEAEEEKDEPDESQDEEDTDENGDKKDETIDDIIKEAEKNISRS